jgi:hypothetical protein
MVFPVCFGLLSSWSDYVFLLLFFGCSQRSMLGHEQRLGFVHAVESPMGIRGGIQARHYWLGVAARCGLKKFAQSLNRE